MPTQESLFVPVSGGDRLHVRRIAPDPAPAGGPRPALLLHGAIENSRIFYSRSGKGLAPWLAREGGYDCYCADLRGRGESQPPLSRASRHGQTEAIAEDLPALARFVAERAGGAPQTWVAHSWGGVLMLSALARFPELRGRVSGLVLFGTKRSVRVWNRERALMIELFWKRAARALALAYGYLPARELNIGSDGESRLSLSESAAWVRPGPWVDPRDGFDYARALRSGPELPPALYVAGARDACLGHPDDVRDFIRETGAAPDRAELRVYAFGHNDMLTSPRAEREIFPEALSWLATRQ